MAQDVSKGHKTPTQQLHNTDFSIVPVCMYDTDSGYRKSYAACAF